MKKYRFQMTLVLMDGETIKSSTILEKLIQTDHDILEYRMWYPELKSIENSQIFFYQSQILYMPNDELFIPMANELKVTDENLYEINITRLEKAGWEIKK